jgi:hypothetical protein
MTFSLIYGQDGVGKTIQVVNICRALEDSIYLSLEVKDDELLETLSSDGIEVVPVMQLYEDYNENPFATLAKFNAEVERILKSGFRNVVIDGISPLRKIAMEVALAEENKDRIAEKKQPWVKIPKEAYGLWEDVGLKVRTPLDRLGNWSHIKKTNVFMTARMKENYVNNVKTGDALDFKDFVRFSVDVKVNLIKDGRGYIAKFEKVPNWAIEAPAEVPLSDRSALFVAFATRGLLK